MTIKIVNYTWHNETTFYAINVDQVTRVIIDNTCYNTNTSYCSIHLLFNDGFNSMGAQFSGMDSALNWITDNLG